MSSEAPRHADLPLGLLHFNHRERPDGEVAWATPGSQRSNVNYGDTLVSAALLRQLAPTRTVRIRFGEEAREPVRAGLLRGSTYLNREFDYGRAIRTIESTDAPVAAVGLGAQAPVADVSFLDDVPDARRFVALLTERSASISARGAFTAAVLERLGATNIRLTGCPSMFYDLAVPRVSLQPALATAQPRLGVSLHTGLRKDRFCRNPAAALRKQNRAIQFALRRASSVALFEQGVVREYAVGDANRPRAERLEAAAQILQRFPRSSTLRPADLVDHLVSVRSIEDWLARAGDLHAMVGFRFHGNMVALSQGVPCFYFVYDSRIAEFCSLYRLPHAVVEDPWRDPIDAMLEHDWDDTTRAIHDCFRELVAFYEENAIAHAFAPSGTRPTRAAQASSARGSMP